MIRGAIDTLSDLLVDKLSYLLSKSVDLLLKVITFCGVETILACLILICLLLITAVLASGLRDPNLIDWLDEEESFRTPMGLHVPKRKAWDFPRPQDDTRNKELAEIIRGQMLSNDVLGTSGRGLLEDLYSPVWALTSYNLNHQKRAELNRIAYEAKSRGDLAKLGLDIKTTGNDTYLTIRDRGHEKATASINVYLLVIGKATPEARNRFLAENPQYMRMYS